jgi:hypothetical protein
MRIAVMLRTLDEKGGVGVYSRNLVETLLDLDSRNEYACSTATRTTLGRYAGPARVTEHVLAAPTRRCGTSGPCRAPAAGSALT